MFSSRRTRLAAAALLAAIASGSIAVAATSASASPGQPARTASAHKVSLQRFDLNGYVINAAYTLGRNTGNTFQQT